VQGIDGMSVGSISFWQQDRNFWYRSAKASRSAAQSAALINVIGNAMTTLSRGLSSIANQTALNRVNSELSAAVQNALQSLSGSSSVSAGTTSSSSSGSSGSSSSSGSAVTVASPAIGTGTAPLTANTSLFTLGILAKGTVTVSDGTNTTTYKSTGTDTVGDLLNAINADVAGHANVAAWLNSNGELVITGKDTTATIMVGGSGIDAAAIGFGAGNDSFQPIKPSSSSVDTSGSSGSSGSSTAFSSGGTGGSTGASTTTSTSSSSRSLLNSAYALQTGGTAEILLASSGSGGTLLNLLA
jgi:hypothetical protein